METGGRTREWGEGRERGGRVLQLFKLLQAPKAAVTRLNGKGHAGHEGGDCTAFKAVSSSPDIKEQTVGNRSAHVSNKWQPFGDRLYNHPHRFFWSGHQLQRGARASTKSTSILIHAPDVCIVLSSSKWL